MNKKTEEILLKHDMSILAKYFYLCLLEIGDSDEERIKLLTKYEKKALKKFALEVENNKDILLSLK